jgi:hypothetical protein
MQLSEAGVLSVSLKMEKKKIEYCTVIKFFVKEGLTPNEIHSKIIKVHGDPSPSFSTIKKWAADFNLLASEFGIKIVAHPVCKMLIIQEPKKVAL